MALTSEQVVQALQGISQSLANSQQAQTEGTRQLQAQVDRQQDGLQQALRQSAEFLTQEGQARRRAGFVDTKGSPRASRAKTQSGPRGATSSSRGSARSTQMRRRS